MPKASRVELIRVWRFLFSGLEFMLLVLIWLLLSWEYKQRGRFYDLSCRYSSRTVITLSRRHWIIFYQANKTIEWCFARFSSIQTKAMGGINYKIWPQTTIKVPCNKSSVPFVWVRDRTLLHCFQTPATQANLAVNLQSGKERKMKAFSSYSNSFDVVSTAYLYRFHDNPTTAIAHFLVGLEFTMT